MVKLFDVLSTEDCNCGVANIIGDNIRSNDGTIIEYDTINKVAGGQNKEEIIEDLMSQEEMEVFELNLDKKVSDVESNLPSLSEVSIAKSKLEIPNEANPIIDVAVATETLKNVAVRLGMKELNFDISIESLVSNSGTVAKISLEASDGMIAKITSSLKEAWSKLIEFIKSILKKVREFLAGKAPEEKALDTINTKIDKLDKSKDNVVSTGGTIPVTDTNKDIYKKLDLAFAFFHRYGILNGAKANSSDYLNSPKLIDTFSKMYETDVSDIFNGVGSINKKVVELTKGNAAAQMISLRKEYSNLLKELPTNKTFSSLGKVVSDLPSDIISCLPIYILDTHDKDVSVDALCLDEGMFFTVKSIKVEIVDGLVHKEITPIDSIDLKDQAALGTSFHASADKLRKRIDNDLSELDRFISNVTTYMNRLGENTNKGDIEAARNILTILRYETKLITKYSNVLNNMSNIFTYYLKLVS